MLALHIDANSNEMGIGGMPEMFVNKIKILIGVIGLPGLVYGHAPQSLLSQLLPYSLPPPPTPFFPRFKFGRLECLPSPSLPVITTLRYLPFARRKWKFGTPRPPFTIDWRPSDHVWFKLYFTDLILIIEPFLQHLHGFLLEMKSWNIWLSLFYLCQIFPLNVRYTFPY